MRNFKAHFVTPQELYEAWKAHDNKKDRAVVQCLWKGVFGFDIQEYPEKDGVEKERMEKWPMAQTIRQRK